MNSPTAEKLQAILSQGRWEQAIELLRQLDPAAAADLIMSLSFEEQQNLFRRLPVDLAATLAGSFPYYHSYILLHSRPVEEMRAIVEKMNPGERLMFFDELPGETWQRLMDELSEKQPAELLGPVEARPAAAPVQPIIEARRIEKGFERPGGGQIQVIAPTSLSVEPGVIIALLGPSGSGKSTLLRMLSGLAQPSGGEVLWHGKPPGESSPNVAIVFQSFALFPWLSVLENVKSRCWHGA